MHPLTAVMVSQALADEHRRAADRRRRSLEHRRRTAATPAPRRPIALPFRLFRPNATGSRA